MASKDEIVTLDVGGTLFKTTLTTLRQYPGSMLAAMIDRSSGRAPAMKSEDGSYFIDRNPKAFAAVLNYLRTKKVFACYDGVTLAEVAFEADYFGLDELSAELNGCEVLIYVYDEHFKRNIFALKFDRQKSVFLLNASNKPANPDHTHAILKTPALHVFDAMGQDYSAIPINTKLKRDPSGYLKAWDLKRLVVPSQRNLVFISFDPCDNIRKYRTAMESPARIQQDIFENWDCYWAQATLVDIGTENDWFALRDNLPTEVTGQME